MQEVDMYIVWKAKDILDAVAGEKYFLPIVQWCSDLECGVEKEPEGCDLTPLYQAVEDGTIDAQIGAPCYPLVLLLV